MLEVANMKVSVCMRFVLAAASLVFTCFFVAFCKFGFPSASRIIVRDEGTDTSR